ncbi:MULTISPECIES: hypothetical protein [unclassified Shewanella]|uniref:hypothetical protein n=1 Tax=unclassified Shewanella TaxID=196818 RepID=UPI001BC4EE8C|nr:MULTISPECIES: hypothetical protein [unclassified Shewanella]GIU19273.1 hypothetical protein TUM4444_35350 [Shewanella sp. MBTL60-112-B1]GIU25071.1 hypothetical protein TUM4445_02800 [Shewanella sp. MBTL60-112-B2]
MVLWMRLTILAALISAAIGCYAAGIVQGATGLVVIGVLFELAFWVGLFKQDRRC